ncbi:MAG TPA: double-strand break repair protein AddB [Methylocella sp.]|nr:double-strand break repair protein AddB [Methylocella sp.]
MVKRVFTIPPGAPFLRTFAAALLDGQIAEGYSRDLPPFGLARATIYVPTQRAARALASELAGALGRPAALLPRILPLGALEDLETSLLIDETGLEGMEELGAPEAADEVTRRLLLTSLILQWARALPHAIVSVDAQENRDFDQSEPFLVATTAADAWHLSGELARLIDELIIEDVAWQELNPLVLPEFDPYWRITLDFLNIAVKEWPGALQQLGLVDRAKRLAALIEAQSRRLREGRLRGPVIAAGSTGSNRATARLLAAIAEAPEGAIVLPGLDCGLEACAWAMIAGGKERGIEASYTHPQSALCRLLRYLQISREDVVVLGSPPSGLAARARFLSEALRPAESTDRWIVYRENEGERQAEEALEGVALIEAADEREEALALAIAMREALEIPGETAALVTPDRALARRVRAELQRWGADAEDSAGEPLSMRPPGTLARLVIDCAASRMTANSLAALIAHPLFRLGLPKEEARRLAALFEAAVLRARCAAGGLAERMAGDPSAMIAAARAEANDHFAHPAKQRISAADWVRLEALLQSLRAALAPLMSLISTHPLPQWASAHRKAIEAVAGMDQNAANEQGWAALEGVFEKLSRETADGMALDSMAYGHFFAALLREAVLREEAEPRPRLQILGLLEARLMDAGVMLLGGLDETVWPPAARADAFLNRPMREALGLSPPERKIGQTAHDFVQAMGNSRVILSRALKRKGAPTIASRFLQRIAAVGGNAWKRCRERGAIYLRLAREIDRPETLRPCERPMPRPSLDQRPSRLSVTQIETLRRDPYALYAEKILRLRPLDPLGGPLGEHGTGSAIHTALERFAAFYPSGPLPPDARERLGALLKEQLAVQLQDADFAAFRWPEIEKGIGFFLRFEQGRRGRIELILAEREGILPLSLADGTLFELTARADRIEINAGKSITLVDYKTGSLPKKKDILEGFSPQLTLEAAMASRDAFGLGFKPQRIEALYLRIRGARSEVSEPFGSGKGEGGLLEIAERHLTNLTGLLNQFRDVATPYPPRPFPTYAKRYNSYDHLARVKEWSVGGEPGNEAV